MHVARDAEFCYLDAEKCPVTGLPVRPRPDWTFFTQDGHYTGYITQIGSTIFIYKAVGLPQPEDSPHSAAHVHRFLAENLPPGEKFYAVFDYSELVSPPVANRLRVLQELEQLKPKIHLIVFFGMSGRVRTIVQVAFFLSRMSRRMFVCSGYVEALRTIQTNITLRGIHNNPVDCADADVALLLRLLSQLVWEEDYTLEVPSLPAGHRLSVAFRAIEVLRDDFRSLQAENRQKQEHLAQANRIKDEFIANMSHEMRTPLNGILGAVQLLQLSNPSERQRYYLKILHESASSLLSGINDLLDLAALDSGRMQKKCRRIQLRTFFAGALGMFEPTAAGKGVVLDLQIAEAVPDAVMGDDDRIRQIVLNLLANAVKFTQRGRVVLHVSTAERIDDTVLLHIQVRDTGPGIPVAWQSRIFERFEQIDSDSEAAFGGTGLGLSISRELAHFLGGDVVLQESDAGGSCFLLQVPVQLASQLVTTEPQSDVGQERPQFSACMLVVDDNEVNRLVLSGLLNSCGISTIESSSGSDALEKIEEYDVDGVFLDCKMPGMDGYATAEAIRARKDAKRSLPIAAVTAYTEPKFADQAEIAGMDAILQKPVRREQLLLLLERWCVPHCAQGTAGWTVDVNNGQFQRAIQTRLRKAREQDIPDLYTAVEAGDRETVGRIAHGLYGVLAQIAAEEPAQRIREIETALSQGENALTIRLRITIFEQSLHYWCETSFAV